MRNTCALVAAVLLAACSPSETVDLRPLSIHVVDAQTREPIADVPVAYAVRVTVTRGKILGFIPRLESEVGERIVHKARARTDAHGDVVFRAPPLVLRRNEYLHDEFAFVNLEPDMSTSRAGMVRAMLERNCAAGALTCGGPVDDIDVGAFLARDPSNEQEVSVRAPCTPHLGALLIRVPGDPRSGYIDWTRPRDPFRVVYRYTGSTGEGEIIRVGLESPEGDRDN